MERICFIYRLREGAEAEYDRRHREPWPELTAEIRAAGVVGNYVFRSGTTIVMYAEHETDVLAAIGRVGSSAVGARWSEHFADLFLPGGQQAVEIWHLE
jgi:L-rhamnose mutarotase